MKVLLDENMPQPLRHLLTNHEVATVAFMNWKSYHNGDLLRVAADAGFELLITRDSSIEYQQHADDLPLAVVTLVGVNNMDDILPLFGRLQDEISRLRPKSFVRISADESES